MNKIIKFITGSCLAIGILAGCNNGGSSSSGGGKTTPATTVLVYVIGTNLQSTDGQALANIVEMESVGSTASMNVVIQTGGANESVGAQGINWTHNQRWKVLKGSLQQISDLGADGGAGGNMGSESTLSSFLNWGVKTYPAKKYIVVLWDHGGGINSGIGSDEITESSIAVNQIANSLSTVATANKVKFQILGFDACLMATTEVASAFHTAADYMVASQDLEPGGGWAYTPFLTYVTNHPTATGVQIGKAIADGYALKMADDVATLSVVQLSKMPAVISATDAFATAMKSHLSVLADWKQIAYARSRALDFYTAAIFGYSTDLVDMNQFVGLVVNNINKYIAPDLILTTAGDALTDAINQAVVYKVSTKSDDGATGLSVYYPSILATYPAQNYTVNTVTEIGGVPFFAPNYTLATTGLVSSYYNYYFTESTNLVATVTTPTNIGGVVNSSTIDNDFNYVLAAHWNPSCKIQTSTVPCIDAMVQAESVTGGISPTFTVQFNQASGASESWVLLAGKPVVMIPDLAVAKTNKYNLYMIPVYDSNGAPGYLQVEQQPSGEFSITGFQPSAAIPGKTYPIQANAVFTLGAYAAAEGGGYSFFATNQTVTADANRKITITHGSVPSGGSNAFGFVVSDLTGTINVSGSIAY